MRSNPTVEDRTWFEFVAAQGNEPAEILIYDYIGSYGVTAQDFDAGLKALGNPVSGKATLRINSPGGETPTAASIYNMLERWLGKYDIQLTVVVDGIAASAASWIAMLGDEVVMPENTLMMIHDPAGFAVGTSRDLRTLASVLDRIKQGMVTAYMKKSGQGKEAVEAIMEAETWYSAEEAVEAGFADRVDNPIDIAASFDLSRFKNPPHAAVGLRAQTGASDKEGYMPKIETAAEMEARLRTEITASLKKDADDAAAATLAAAAKTVPAVAETADQIAARVRKDIGDTNAEISSLCIIAGKPELVAGFVAAGKTVAQVRVDLEVAAKAAPTKQAPQSQQLNTHTGVDKDASAALTAKDINTNMVWANYRKGKGTPVSYGA